MEQTIKTLSEIVKKYRNKNMREASLAQKLSEDLIKTIGITKLDAVTVIKDLLMTKYNNISLGDTSANERLIDDVLYTFDKCGGEVKGDLQIPTSGLHEIEQPLTREQVVKMYSQTKEIPEVEEVKEVEDKIVKPKVKKTNTRRKKIARRL